MRDSKQLDSRHPKMKVVSPTGRRLMRPEHLAEDRAALVCPSQRLDYQRTVEWTGVLLTQSVSTLARILYRPLVWTKYLKNPKLQTQGRRHEHAVVKSKLAKMPADVKNDLSEALINAKPFGVRISLEDR
ncbi:hypothetical protein D9C73_016054 [Collichthys lucidus]|uniref:Uncharacterized protein n=1 Tax=Collichthys lucidus TaxID=240159 RepID=A0A4U5V2G7_COLLU|nr:hypothetical protein D9C73_016054 [Collichthys lucidus]